MKKFKGFSIKAAITILEHCVEWDLMYDSSVLNYNMAQLMYAYSLQKEV